MTTLTFRVQVNEQTGVRLRQNKQERKKINLLIRSFLENSNPNNGKEALLNSMSELSAEAKSNGLTDEILAQILKDIDAERD